MFLDTLDILIDDLWCKVLYNKYSKSTYISNILNESASIMQNI